MRKDTIKIDDSKSITLFLTKEKDLFIVHAIEWETNIDGATNSEMGERILYQPFLDEGSARKFYEETLETWK